MNVYASEGLRGFYKGYLPRIMKKGCSGGILWTLYEKFS
jgi:solute carrier family 25 protein 38